MDKKEIYNKIIELLDNASMKLSDGEYHDLIYLLNKYTDDEIVRFDIEYDEDKRREFD